MTENKRILIVDDEPYNILGLKIVLQQSGVKNILSIVDTAHNGKQANEMVEQAFESRAYSYGLTYIHGLQHARDERLRCLRFNKGIPQLKKHASAHDYCYNWTY